MPGNNPNLYQRARKESPYTQEQAAELLHVSETTVKAWEQGQRTPDNPIVNQMAEVYDAPWLRSERAVEIFGELGIKVSGVTPMNLQCAVLSHYDLMQELMDGYRRLIQIAADGHVDPSEEEDYQNIRDMILCNSVAGLRLVFCPVPEGTKKDRPDAGTSRRLVQRTMSKNDRKNILSHRSENVNHFVRGGGVSL